MNAPSKTLPLMAFAVGILLILGGGMNLDARHLATAVCSFIAAGISLAVALLLAAEYRK